MTATDHEFDQLFLPPKLSLADTELAARIEEILAPVRLGGSTLLRVMKTFEDEMDRGLNGEKSSLQMENTYVPELPDGSEEGIFLALDLGGTNFRVLLLEMKNGEPEREEVRKYHISEVLRFGPGQELFDFLAECVADFIKIEGLTNYKDLPLGFTFSFPMIQHSLNSGNLTTWTKSFNCPGMENKDVVQMLDESLKRNNVHNVTVVALLNDTTGTLVAGARVDRRTGIGVILGTGSNGCYMEKADSVSHWETEHEKVKDVVVDIEWGAFGDNGCLDFIKTDFDIKVDSRSLLVNSFTFEKYIGGKYLGDVVHAVLEKLESERLIGSAPAHGEFTTQDISEIEQDCECGKTEATERLLGCSAQEAKIAQYVCNVISNRAAQLVSVCIAAILRRSRRRSVTSVAIDGSLFKLHPTLRKLMNKYITLLAPTKKIEEILAPVRLGGSTLLRVMKTFEDEMDRGLNGEKSSLQMENTYVPELPDGSEEGIFLALDLGGTNFRVLLLEMKNGEPEREEVRKYHISEVLRFGPGQELFDFLAECVADFIKIEGLTNYKDLPLGFTFSFPMIQHSLNSGNLTTWTKSFNCPGMENKDVVQMLDESLKRNNVHNVTVVALLNDTTGTLVAGARVDRRTGIGVILGTGSNGCYMEKADSVSHWETEHEKVKDVVVDIEWGAFGDNGCLDFIKTDFDIKVDSRSLLVNSFTFEKYIGGKYLGDVVHAVLEKLESERLIGSAPAHGEFTTQDISEIEQDCECGKTEATERLLGCSAQEAKIAQYVCNVISNRAAQLVSVCIAAILRRSRRRSVTSVAIDGSLFKLHPTLRKLMNKYITLLAPTKKFELILAEDGSGKGAALTAAVAVRLKRQAAM